MRERMPINHSRRAIAGVLAVAALSGCTKTPTHIDRPALGIQRCFDAPLPNRVRTATDPYNYQAPIRLHYDRKTRTISAVPKPRKAALAALKAGSVKILAGPAVSGSGFVVHDRAGKPVVVTAAHVTTGASLANIQIQDTHGNSVDIVSGCYIYESNGRFTDPAMPVRQDTDIAILRPAQPLDAAPLRIAKKAPGRGTWLQLVNNQLDGNPRHPSSYSALTLTSEINPQGITALSGLEPHRDAPEQYTVHSGASGGVAGNMQTGVVEGMVYAGTPGNQATDTHYERIDTIRNIFDTHIDASVGPATGIYPVEASIIAAPVLRQALASTAY